jgi:hypothetical protein
LVILIDLRFHPVLGYAEDAIIVAIALRGVVRRMGIDELRRHWPGTEDGFAALCRLTGVSPSFRDWMPRSGKRVRQLRPNERMVDEAGLDAEFGCWKGQRRVRLLERSAKGDRQPSGRETPDER